MSNDPKAKQKIDAYIAKLPTWSKTKLVRLRKLIHKAAPDITEDWKWGPNFSQNGLVCNIGAFQGWVKIHFFHGAAMKDKQQLFNDGFGNSSGRSINIKPDEKINDAAIMAYVREAVVVNGSGRKLTTTRKPWPVNPLPADVKKLLVKHDLVDAYNDRPPYQKRDYVNWFLAAKQEKTRTGRVETMIEDLQEGRYMKMEWAKVHRKGK